MAKPSSFDPSAGVSECLVCVYNNWQLQLPPSRCFWPETAHRWHLHRVPNSFPYAVCSEYTEVHGGGISRYCSTRAHTAYGTPALTCLCVSPPLVRLRHRSSLVAALLSNDFLVSRKMGLYAVLLHDALSPQQNQLFCILSTLPAVAENYMEGNDCHLFGYFKFT